MTKADDATAVQMPRAAAAPSRDTRFTPGTVLLNRYRIISLLGRGGMGEIYRAEDMKLGQQVALKFVARELANDRTILEHLVSEVRIGREVAHPNVCRLYDIVEVDGDHFIAMQYVDGEDLASLLRRIGRLPVEKAIDIARDLCAGLAAAHDRGVIHRDLKPANVMIDGKGRAHITDFGLAVASDDAHKRGVAGTPVYMAPEQLAGERVTPSSDLYALGLIVYEILTGKRMFEPAASMTQIAEQHQQPKPRLTSSVRDVPPRVDAIVMQCLEEDPANRPSSARHVLAALPGGDPLAAAIAAGETPSPEMVAAASATGELPAPFAVGAVVLFVAMLIGLAALSPMTTFFSRERLRKTPEALSDRAEEIVRLTGVSGEPVDHGGFFIDRNRELRAKVEDRDRLAYFYRRSVAPLTTQNAAMLLRTDDPPLVHPHSANVQLASDGRLLSLVVVPDQSTHAPANSLDDLFKAAGYDRAQFHRVPTNMPPPVGSDERMAWDGPAHIEAAAFHGAIDWFAVNPLPAPLPVVSIAGVGGVVNTIMFLALVAIAVTMATINVRRGRTDFRGGLRAAAFIFASSLLSLLRGAHITSVGLFGHIGSLLGNASFDALVFLITYLASEPHVRRYWPAPLISWQRLLEGRWRDSLVARHLGAGLLLGLFSALKTRVFILIAHEGVPRTSPPFLSSLQSTPDALSWILHVPAEALGYGLGALFFMLLGRISIKRAWIYAPAFALMLAVAMSPKTGDTTIDFIAGLISAVLVLYALHEGGILMVAAAWFIYHLFEGLPLTLDFGRWYSGTATFVGVVLIAVVAFAFYSTLPRGRALASAPATT